MLEFICAVEGPSKDKAGAAPSRDEYEKLKADAEATLRLVARDGEVIDAQA